MGYGWETFVRLEELLVCTFKTFLVAHGLWMGDFPTAQGIISVYRSHAHKDAGLQAAN